MSKYDNSARPGLTAGLRHVALFVSDLEGSEDFFVNLMGMNIEWRPDADNVYLTSGNDNLALHRAASASDPGYLDHVGFFLAAEAEVDPWFKYLKDNGVKILTEPRTHRDGARSFYCADPSGVKVQVIFHPPIAAADAALDPER
jgi:catechol 2,3-dioxygenase-like lactoylglutathione lyase family enzyme